MFYLNPFESKYKTLFHYIGDSYTTDTEDQLPLNPRANFREELAITTILDTAVLNPNKQLGSEEEIFSEDDSDDQIVERKKSLFWAVSIFNSTAQKFYGDYFSPFAAKIGVAGWLLGFLTSIRNLFSSLFQGLFGRMSDKIGRKLFLIISLSLSFVITFLLIFFGNQNMIIIASIFQSIAICIFTPSWNAAIGDVTRVKNRGTFMGKISAVGQMISVSFTLFTAAIFFLAERFEGRVIYGWTVYLPWETQYQIAFAASSISYIIALAIIIGFKETHKVKNLAVPQEKTNLFEPFKSSTFKKFLLIHIVYSVVMSSVWPLMPFIQINIIDMKFYQIAIASATFAVCMGFFQWVGGRMADKIGRKKVIIIGATILVLFPISYTPAIIFGRWEFSILANFIAGSGSGFFYTTINTYILDLSKRNSMGSFAGWKEALTGIATFIGSLSGGFIIDALTNSYGLVIMGISMTIGVTILRGFALIGYFFVKDNFANHNHKVNIKQEIV
ncbi:MAG: MFS transporter [Candidatus Heimdallarchaeota archaeon]|nr:MFS transporter [Candidatus Heimdallarchaeota archaeon]